jgi:hypothetical protein
LSGRGGQPTSITSTEVVSGAHTAIARLASDGTLNLAIDGKQVAQGKAPGPITTMPVDGLAVGFDDAGLVGPYAENNQFRGSIESVQIKLE